MNEQFIPAIITASVALLAAIGAQLLSHYLNSRRENKKYDNEVYQEFIYPFIPEVLFYYHTETHFRKGHDVEQEVNIHELLEKVSKKVSYGNMKLLTYFYETKKYDFFFDGRGWSKERNMLKFLFFYLDYSVQILKNRKQREQLMIDEVIKVQKLYGIWLIFAEEMEFDIASDFMRYDFLLRDCFLSEISTKNLRTLVEDDTFENSNKIDFLKSVVSEFQHDGDVSSFISDQFNEHMRAKS